jgi:cytochrome b561
VWRVYARFKRMVGRQRLSRIRPWITLAIFPTLVALLAYAARGQPGRLAWLAAGLAAGTLLAHYGWKKTALEPTARGLFYTPNAHLGIALSLLFVARIVYRFVEIYVIDSPGSRDAADFVQSSLTLSVFGLLAGYYIAYAVSLARWRWRVLRAKRLREAAQAATAEETAGAP